MFLPNSISVRIEHCKSKFQLFSSWKILEPELGQLHPWKTHLNDAPELFTTYYSDHKNYIIYYTLPKRTRQSSERFLILEQFSSNKVT